MASTRSIPDEINRFHHEQYPFHWIVTVHARYTRLMEIELKKVDLDVSRFRILSLAREFDSASITRISEHAIIKMPTVVKIVARLKEEGLLTTCADESDGRVTLISLTDAGNSLLDKATNGVHQVFAKAFEGISELQAERMNMTLAMILVNMTA